MGGGVYEVYGSFYMISQAQRPNVGIEFTIDGVKQNIRGDMGYIRNLGNHNQSSVNLRQTLQLISGQKIGVSFIQLAQLGIVSLIVNTSILSIKRIA